MAAPCPHTCLGCGVQAGRVGLESSGGLVRNAHSPGWLAEDEMSRTGGKHAICILTSTLNVFLSVWLVVFT